MKKLFLIAFLFCISLVTFANSDNSTNNVSNDTLITESVQLFNKIYDDIKVGLSALGESLQIGAEHVYKVLIKQQFVNSIVYLISLLLSSIIFIISLYKLTNIGWNNNYYYSDEWQDEGGRKAYKKENFSEDNIIYLVLGIFSLVLLLVSISFIDVMITGFINPEYGAMKDILNFIK